MSEQKLTPDTLQLRLAHLKEVARLVDKIDMLRSVNKQLVEALEWVQAALPERGLGGCLVLIHGHIKAALALREDE